MKSFASLVILILTLATAPALLATTVYTAVLLGSSEVPSNASTATGSVTLTLTGDSLTVNETFSGLVGGSATAAHIHCCVPPGTNAIVAVPLPGFPTATSGTYLQTFDLTLLATYNSSFVTAHGGTAASAEAALIAALDGGQAYSNIHNSGFPGGEIRGQLAAAVPEPATLALAGAGLWMLALLRRRMA